MGLIDDARLYSAAKALAEMTQEEAMKMTGTKPGWKTTEFWMTLMTNLIGVLGMAKGAVPPQYQPYVIGALTVLNSVYTIARTFIKQTPTATVATVSGPAVVTTTTTKP